MQPSSVDQLPVMRRTSLLFAVALAACALALPQATVPSDSEQCRPKPPQPGKENAPCCEIPDVIILEGSDKLKKFFSECIEQMEAAHPDAKPPSPQPTSAGSPMPPQNGGSQRKLFVTCVDECVFNKTGLLTTEMKLDAAVINKMVGEVLGADTAWKSVGEEVIKICLENSNKVKDEGDCKSGSHEFLKCCSRQMFLKCPKEKWQDNEDCQAEKELLEKCPNMMPRSPHPSKKDK